MDRFRPDTFLPLTPVAFEIMLALADGDQHGYAILREVEQRSSGAITLHPGTLYRALARMLESELIEEIEADDLSRRSSRDDGTRAKVDDERRRYYRLTTRGIAVAKAEMARLENQLASARARRLLGAR